jgi:hypothetical protein
MSFMSVFWSVFAIVFVFELWIVFRHSNLSKYDRRHYKNSLFLLLLGVFLSLIFIQRIENLSIYCEVFLFTSFSIRCLSNFKTNL